MKKIMLIVAVAFAAIASNAASIKWTTDKIYAPDASGAMTETLLKNADYTSFFVTVSFYDKDGNAITTVANNSSSTFAKSGSVTATTTGYDFLVDTDYQYSAHYELVMGGKTYTMDVAKTTFTQNMGTGNFNLTVPTAGTWDVPEPTSGLLLLVGVAGLALRRRRA